LCFFYSLSVDDDPYSLTIPASSVFNYPYLSVYFNSYIDGAMHLNFSGGVTGHALLAQAHDRRWTPSSCFSSNGGCSCYADYDVKMITTSSDSGEIVFLSPTQVLDEKFPQCNHVVISLGCKINQAS
jgi:hypothetical protein